jgi:large subunit ribosomal protein L17
MRHRKKISKLGRNSSHRKATLQNIARGLFEHHKIKTTLVKAKAARSFVERIITHGKKNTVASRRLVFKALQNHQLVKKVFDEIVPTFSDRNGGYTRVVKLGRRKGDGAELAILQLVGYESLIIDEKKSSPEKKSKKKVKEESVKVEKKDQPPSKEKEEKKTDTPKETKKETVASRTVKKKTEEEKTTKRKKAVKKENDTK